MMTFSEICDWIVLLGAVALALERIYNLFVKPQKKVKETIAQQIRTETQKVLEEKIPVILEEHSKEVAEQRASEREDQLQKIKSDILEETKTSLANILEINLKQSESINILMISSKDMLRQRIMDIYHEYKSVKRLPLYAREKLDELYKDYKAENGNSYIDKYYNRMLKWEVYDDEDEE